MKIQTNELKIGNLIKYGNIGFVIFDSFAV